MKRRKNHLIPCSNKSNRGLIFEGVFEIDGKLFFVSIWNEFLKEGYLVKIKKDISSSQWSYEIS